MPSWSDLSPSGLAPHFKRLWAFKYDREAGDFTARLAGNRAMVGFGKSFRGTPLKDLHPPHIFELAQAHMGKVVNERTAYYCSGKLFRAGTQEIEGERTACWPDRMVLDLIVGIWFLRKPPGLQMRC